MKNFEARVLAPLAPYKKKPYPPPFIAITESWLKSYITDAQVEIENYQTLRSDRPIRVGGGCLLYVHDQLVITETDHYEDRSNNMIMCYIKSSNTICATVYRPPGPDTPGFTKLLNQVQANIDTISENSTSPDIHILGDFNYPDLDWAVGDTGGDAQGKDLIEFMDRNFLTQMVDQPTRGRNTLDLVLTNVPRYITEVQVTPTPLSDHNIVKLQLGFNMLEPKTAATAVLDPLSFRAVNYHKADYEAMNRDLNDVNWGNLWDLCDGDLDSYLELFRLTVLQITLKHSPRKENEKEFANRQKRGNKQIYVLKRKRRKLNARIRALEENNPSCEVLKKHKEEVSLLCYNIQEGILQRLNKKELKAVDTIKKNPKLFFSYAKRLQKTKSTIPVLKDENGILVDDPRTKAELLQKQYQKVFSDPEQADIEKCLQGRGLPQGLDRAFDELFFT